MYKKLNTRHHYLPRCWIIARWLVNCWLASSTIMQTTMVGWLAFCDRKITCRRWVTFDIITFTMWHHTLSSIITVCKSPTWRCAVFWHIVVTWWPLLHCNVVGLCQISKVVGVTSKVWSTTVSGKRFTVWQKLVITDWSHWHILTSCDKTPTHIHAL